MTFDATFCVAISFFIFFGLLIYLKIPGKVNELLANMITDIKKEIDESEKLRAETKRMIDDAQKKLNTADKEVNKNVLVSFNQKINVSPNYIESIYFYKKNPTKEFIRIKYIPPGRILIYKGDAAVSRYVQVLDHIPLGENKARVIVIIGASMKTILFALAGIIISLKIYFRASASV